MSNKFTISILVTLILLFSTSTAFAYLDPATGSIILQGLLAGIAGALFAIKIFFSNIRDFFANIKQRLSSSKSNESPQSENETIESQKMKSNQSEEN